MGTTRLVTSFYSTEDGEEITKVEGTLLDYKEGEKINLTVFTINSFTEYEIIERMIDEISAFNITVERKYRIYARK